MTTPHDTTRVILITGASSGVGLALARRLWTRNERVVVTARASSLERFKTEQFHESDRFLIRPLEITDAGQRNALVQEIEQRWGGIDVLVNNAGIAYRSVVEQMSDEEELQQLRTNYLAPMALTRLVIPSMRRKRWGRVINISSVGGMMAMPTMGSYSASKFALEGASEALWYELRPWNVAVTLVQPGFIHSNSFQHVVWSRDAEKARSGGDYHAYYQHMSAFIEKVMRSTFATADSVARKILGVIDNPAPPLRVPATIDAYFFSLFRRLLPRRMYHWILYRNLPGIEKWGTHEPD